MFIPIRSLPQYNEQSNLKYRDRWYTEEGTQLYNYILNKIRSGAGQRFLLGDYEDKKLGFLESESDLKGIHIGGETIDFPRGDNFDGIDFSYASFSGVFTNAIFLSTKFNFTKFFNFEFIKCTFLYVHFYGASFEKVKFSNCDFVERNDFINCDLKDVGFQNSFFPTSLFSDCKFDILTTFGNFAGEPQIAPVGGLVLNKTELANIYKGIKEGYFAGAAHEQARQYFYKEKHYFTRYNSKGVRNKIFGLCLDLISGYGVRPWRVLFSMLMVFAIFSLVFCSRIGFSNGLLLSAGAFFTFGANTSYLQCFGNFFRLMYILESFLGVSFMALFITVLANVWFREK